MHKHLVRAIAVAGTSTQRSRHGVVIACGSRVLSVGVNTSRNHPALCSDPTTQASFHAEVMALRALRSDIKHERLSLFSARIRKDGTPALAKPCSRCMAVLEYEGITDIYWTED